jgi:hypothetical protein
MGKLCKRENTKKEEREKLKRVSDESDFVSFIGVLV